MTRACLAVAAVAAKAGAIVALTGSLSAQGVDVHAVLRRAGERVTEYFARAQSIMCLERVSLQRLGISFGADGPARRVESELRLSWEPSPDNPVPTEARTLRQVLRVNGAPPRKKDFDNCTTPEQQDSEEQPLSMLLPAQREKYTFTFSGRQEIDRREVIVVEFREIRKAKVDSWLVDGKDDCLSYEIEGGSRGKIWIDAATHDVLRLDRSLSGLIEIPLPRKATRRPGSPMTLTVERSDTSIRFRRVSFDDPQETMVLPVESSTLQITRGSGSPRLRTTTQYQAYRRFLTAGRIVPQ